MNPGNDHWSMMWWKPYLKFSDAVAEATLKIIKTEFVKKRVFSSLTELEREFQDYVNGFNHLRIHGTLNYQSSVRYKQSLLKKIV
ncbi:IS3 family transposase [Exiguobacterium artemiae]|uniref:IS3 family transposase n=1 Tax=Exiguobacterium artemiae TaxID=340145 RepID=UPI00047E3F85